MPSDITIKPLRFEWNNYRKSKTKNELERGLTDVLATTPDISCYALAKKLGVTVHRLESLFPELAVELHRRTETQVKKRRWRRLLALGRTLRILRRELTAEGRVFNVYNVHARTGILIREDQVEARLFHWVQQRQSSRQSHVQLPILNDI